MAYLTERVVDLDLAWREGLRSGKPDVPKDEDKFAKGSQWRKHGLGRIYSSHLIVPYPFALDGKDRVRLRIHNTTVEFPAEENAGHVIKEGKTVTYPRWLATKDVPAIPYIPRHLSSTKLRDVAVVEDVSVPLFIVEAPVKALSMISHGFHAIAVAGVEAGFIDAAKSLKKKGIYIPQHELGRVAWSGRIVYIVYDAGIWTNPAVARGAAKLATILRAEGADVRLVLLPLARAVDIQHEMADLGIGDEARIRELLDHAKDSGDQGPDDFLARQQRYAAALGHGDPKAFAIRAMNQLVDEAVPAEPARWVQVVMDECHTRQARVTAVRDLIESLPYQGAIAVGGEGATSAVSALTETVGFRKKALAEAVGKFDARVMATLTADEPAWRGDLQRSKAGAILGSLANARMFRANDPALQDLFRFDEFLGDITFGGKQPWSTAQLERRLIQDVDVIELRTYLQTQGCAVAKDDLWDAVIAEARNRTLHPVKQYLVLLKWDGVERLDRWLHTYLGAEDTEYTRLVGPWWMQQAADRILNPGCQADYTLVLEGIQGVKKTSTCRTLAVRDEWFRGAPLDIANKDTYGLLSGAWIYELGEGAILRRADMRLMKQFLTERSDKWRPSYARAFVVQDRQVCFVMTTNDTEYLVDDTGNRRYWPVRCGAVDLDRLRQDIDQLWAEAVTRSFKKLRRWPTDEEEARLFRPEQDKRHETDAWEAPIRKYLAGRVKTTVEDIMSDALSLQNGKRQGKEGKRISAILQHRLGWLRRQDGGGCAVYERPTPVEAVPTPVEVETAASVLRAHRWTVAVSGIAEQFVITATRDDDDDFGGILDNV